MIRRLFSLNAIQCIPLIVFFLCSAASIHAGEKKDRPNILFLLTDQWRFDSFGYAGNSEVITPHIDKLESESINFTHAVSGVPVCCPMRASLLTGQRPLTHGVFMNDVSLNPDAHSIAKVLNKNGYKTGYIGKWHIDGRGRSSFIPRERRQGFQYWKVLECTHNYNNSFYYADGPEKLKWDGYDAIAQTKDAQQFIRDQVKAQKPFSLFIGFGPPHAPYHSAPEKYRKMYEGKKISVRPNIPHSFREIARKDLRGYYAHCTALDDCVQQLRATLKEQGIEKNTLIVLTSDHGDLIGSHGAYKKQQPYDESIRVPMLFHLPDLFGSSGKRLKSLMNTEDLMPTLLGLCGIDIPDSVEGLDFSRHMLGGPNPNDGSVVISCPAPFGQWARRWGGREFRGLRTERYTYVEDLRGPWLLYDNQVDPYQLHNLLSENERPELAQKLGLELHRKLKKQNDSFQPASFYVKKWGYPLDKTGTVPYTN